MAPTVILDDPRPELHFQEAETGASVFAEVSSEGRPGRGSGHGEMGALGEPGKRRSRFGCARLRRRLSRGGSGALMAQLPDGAAGETAAEQDEIVSTFLNQES